ncbi:MAG: penicillin-binding protein 1C [Bacteroidota bacterium]
MTIKSFFRTLLGVVLLLFLLWWCFALPRPLFEAPLATVIVSAEEELLGARIAADGQWRFPASQQLPERLERAILTFEDQRFYQHWGVDLRALARALRQNWRAGRIRSGGSTISMQVMRMARGNQARTLWQKLLEIVLALRLEWRYDKAEILQFWAANASYGGNVVGADAAAWRYYQKPPHLLSWAEAATLAVLPNSPALIHPGRNRAALRAKRDRLLSRLQRAGYMDETTRQLAILEPLPDRPLPLPQLAPHLLQRVHESQGPGRWTVSIDPDLQRRVQAVAQQQQALLAGNGIHNVAILVLDNERNNCLAYLGNHRQLASVHSPGVDIVQAPRSPGSLLKPMLYSLALQNGQLLPQQLLADVPSVYGDFRPENFSETYQGAVPADQALARSLNIPFVRLLQTYGVPIFYDHLRSWGFDFLQQPASHYGLSLILGGGEVSLWQVCRWYSSLARTLNHYQPLQSQYDATDWQLPSYLDEDHNSDNIINPDPESIGAGAAWWTLKAMEKLERPDSEGAWKRFASSRKLAWKTGTSFGFRDAWAVGVSPRYTIGVWVGNADGEGRPGLVGIRAAAPILFAVQRLLPAETAWFDPPWDDLVPRAVCAMSGCLAERHCPRDTIWSVATQQRAGHLCGFHRRVSLDRAEEYQVTRACVADPSEMVQRSWFQLPALQAHYYQRQHPAYRPLPPPHPDCDHLRGDTAPMAWIYPNQEGHLQIPVTWDGSTSAILFTLAHHYPDKRVHWHLDQEYVGTTQGEHQLELRPDPGRYRLLATDEDGERLWFDFTVADGS